MKNNNKKTTTLDRLKDVIAKKPAQESPRLGKHPVDMYDEYLEMKTKEQLQEYETMETVLETEPTEAVKPAWNETWSVKYNSNVRDKKYSGMIDSQGIPIEQNHAEDDCTPDDGNADLGQLTLGYGDESPEAPSPFREESARSHKKLKRVAPFPATASSGRGFNKTATYMEPSARLEDANEEEMLPELESSDAKMPADLEMFDVVRNGFKIYRLPERTLIYAIVVDKTGKENQAASLRCFGGVAFGGYMCDLDSDAYFVECVPGGAIHLGTVPFSFEIRMPKCGKWSVEIPIPEKVLEKYFSPAQRKMLVNLREKFSADQYEIQYLQMLLAN